MKFSTRARYGLKAVVDLAAEYGKAPQSISLLAAKQGISEAYLEQLLRSLKQNNIVNTVRGINGGYVLVDDPNELSVGRVLNVLEGGTAVTDCVSAEGSVCKNACTCSTRPLFLKLQSRIDALLEQTSVKSLLDDNTEQIRRLEDAKSLS